MKVHIVTNTQKDKDRSVTEAIVRELLDLGVEVSSDVPSVADAFQSVNFRETAEGIETCDIVLSVGGDGTILRAAKKASEEEKPILGVNMGKVGFLAEVEPVEVTLLNRLVDGKYTVDERMMLDCKVVRNGKVCFSCSALNDVVISHGAVSRTVGIKVDSDVGFISEYSADWLYGIFNIGGWTCGRPENARYNSNSDMRTFIAQQTDTFRCGNKIVRGSFRV